MIRKVWRLDKFVGTEIFIGCMVTAPATLRKMCEIRDMVEREGRTRK